MKRLSTILDSIWIFATVLMFGVGCGAGTRVAYTETRETLDASGAVIGKETVSVERNSKAINTKVELKDLESTLTFSPTNGLSSGLSTSDFKGSPETAAFEAFEKGLGTAAAVYGLRQSEGQPDTFTQQLILELIRNQSSGLVASNAPPPSEELETPISPEDRELLNQIPDLRDDLEAIRVAIQAQQGPPEPEDGE